jgi:hypothetical protein
MKLGNRATSASRIGLVLAAFVSTAAFSFEALFAPGAHLWPRWQAHDPASTARIDHAELAGLLERYRRPGEDGIARFDYAAVTRDDRRALAAYIDRLAQVPIGRYGRDAQFAYWVNLYNALTLHVVLEHYPVDSIRDIDLDSGLFGDGPWDADLVRVDGEPLSLNDIEHRILRPIWRDPRVHYVVNCAALGCPDLPAQPLTADGLERTLNEAARTYVNHPRGVAAGRDGVVVSSIYVWFSEDFGDGDGDVLAHLARHAQPPLQADLAAADAIGGHRYDWALNDVAGSGSGGGSGRAHAGGFEP